MEKKDALDVLSALAHEGRLDILRELVAAGEDGLAATDVAVQTGALQNTTSTNLAILARAGLIDGERQGRSIRYRAELSTIRGLIAYLLQDCCNGRPELCVPLINDLSCITPGQNSGNRDDRRC
ncbi:ArsR/SmtB family transcription factor [Cucumibacter marinus]|uniref:ArsR/SmtB family transcription factor n=1 Tax=Cucumibacter marinus TaxID=1121252 RepID=UPI0004149378|nr:metalloregulator ArsR/SmtB family transcription factor [Cucumibacter marinus]